MYVYIYIFFLITLFFFNPDSFIGHIFHTEGADSFYLSLFLSLWGRTQGRTEQVQRWETASAVWARCAPVYQVSVPRLDHIQLLISPKTHHQLKLCVYTKYLVFPSTFR